jgi:hypothetical protein
VKWLKPRWAEWMRQRNAKTYPGGLDSTEEQEPPDDRTGQQPFGDGPGRAGHDAGIWRFRAQCQGGQDIGAEVDAEYLQWAQRYQGKGISGGEEDRGDLRDVVAEDVDDEFAYVGVHGAAGFD